MRAHIQIVGFNHREHLTACLRSVCAQTARVPVLYIDNGSTDGSVKFVQQEFPDVRVIANAVNRGYCGGHNDGLRTVTDTDVVIVLNPDVVLEPEFVERGLATFARPSIAAVAPLLLRSQTSEVGSRGRVIDAFGDVLLPSLRAVNHLGGKGLSDLRRPISDLQPWGFTGAAAFLRRAALEDVALNGEVLDEDLFAYREDVDLSWRFRLRGWEIVGARDARATHARAARAGQMKDALVARLSWRNYYLVLVKDVPRRILVRHFPWILLEDLARDVQLLIHPRLWPAVPEVLRLLPRFLEKRRAVLARASVEDPLRLRQRAPGRFPDGRIDYHGVAEAPVLNVTVRREDGRILLLKRSERVGSYRGRWHVIGGYLDEPSKSVEEKAREELHEELGIPKEAAASVQSAEPFDAFDPDVAKTWRIHPVLVELAGNPPITLDWEHTESRWVRPEDVASYSPIPTVPEVLRRLSIEVEPL